MSIGSKNKAVPQNKRTPSPPADSKPLEVALANLAGGDDYADWLISQRGTVPKDIKLGW